MPEKDQPKKQIFLNTLSPEQRYSLVHAHMIKNIWRLITEKPFLIAFKSRFSDMPGGVHLGYNHHSGILVFCHPVCPGSFKITTIMPNTKSLLLRLVEWPGRPLFERKGYLKIISSVNLPSCTPDELQRRLVRPIIAIPKTALRIK